MHLPPAVSYEVVRSRWHFFIAATVSVMILVVVFGFWIQQANSWRSGCVTFAGALCILLSAHAWRNSPTGLLQWSGAHWLWSGFGNVPLKSLELRLDLQVCMCVEITSESGKKVWAFLEPGRDRLHWMRLRRAITGYQPDRLRSVTATPSDAPI